MNEVPLQTHNPKPVVKDSWLGQVPSVQERLTKGTVTSTMRRAAHPSAWARCDENADFSAIAYESHCVHRQVKALEFSLNDALYVPHLTDGRMSHCTLLLFCINLLTLEKLSTTHCAPFALDSEAGSLTDVLIPHRMTLEREYSRSA